MSRGVYYIATGAEHYKYAERSRDSVKKYGIPVAICTNQDTDDGWDTVIQRNETPKIKVDYITETPFDETLYLDADTLVLDDVTDIFQLFDRFDILLTHAHQRNRAPQRQGWRTTFPYCFPQFNGGVMGYNQYAKEVLAYWADDYYEAGYSKDQVTLRELIWESNLRVYVLPPEYNINRKHIYEEMKNSTMAKPKIYHYTGGQKELPDGL
jgi:lipopolysaccharide biosynthesis glycosyltransferase